MSYMFTEKSLLHRKFDNACGSLDTSAGGTQACLNSSTSLVVPQATPQGMEFPLLG